MADQIDIERPEENQTRSELSLGRIARYWRVQSRGTEFIQALLGFFKGLEAQPTLRSYTFSVVEMFGWYEREHRQIVTPDQVSRGQAADYARWLRNRSVGLDVWRLKLDPERRLDLAIVEIIGLKPGCDIDHIRSQLMRRPGFSTYYEGRSILQVDRPPGGGLGHRLACLAKIRTLYRKPTIEEIRRESPGTWEAPPDEIFRYLPPQVTTAPGADRSSSIVTRLSALSSLWVYLMRSGENAPGQTKPLLQHNIWLAPLKAAQAQAPSHQAATRARKTPTIDLALKLLATTFYRTHGKEQALRAAYARMWGQPLPAGKIGTPFSFKDLRDQLVILLMIQIGARAVELERAQRRDISGDPPTIQLLGKRGKRRALQVPPPVLMVYRELTEKLQLMADRQIEQGGVSRAEILLSSSAPLVPAVAYRGANAWIQEEMGISRSGISMMMRRRAIAAGIKPRDAEFVKLHPHGMRHLFAKMALESGTPMNKVQAMLGHTSLASTGIYTEERDPKQLISEAFKPKAPAPAPVAPPAPPAPAVPTVPAWDPEGRPIKPPRMPKPKPPKPAAKAPPASPAAPETAMGQVMPPPKPRAESRVKVIEQAREAPISQREETQIQACQAVGNDALRQLCEIYELHWGEAGDRQPLIKPEGVGRKKGSGKLVANPAGEDEYDLDDEDIDEEDLDDEGDSYDLDDEDIDDYDDEAEETYAQEEDDDLEDLEIAELEDEEEERKIQEAIKRQRAGAAGRRRVSETRKKVTAEIWTQKAANIFSGKSSGLSWWTGTTGKLKPELPVLSPAQVGQCTAGEQDPLCRDLVKLWHRWAEESITKADALVRWIHEALDLAGHMEVEVIRRDGRWISSGDAWELTKIRGSKRSPKPRLVFREHIETEIVAWFERVAWQYRSSPGNPEAFEKAARVSKVRDEAPPAWFDRPIASLPQKEREDLLDWITALTGGLPSSTSARYGRVSRRDVALCINDLCRMDKQINAYREDKSKGPSFVGGLWKHERLEDLPSAVRLQLSRIQLDARRDFSAATLGKVASFDAWGAIRSRVRGKRRTQKDQEAEAPLPRHNKQWYLNVIAQVVSKDAAKDPILAVVAQCGDVPLSGYKDLFKVQGNNIVHDQSFIVDFARKHGVHSECVARRIARRLWEYRKANPRGEYVTKPAHMLNLVKVMQTMRVPCTRAQQIQLQSILGAPKDPDEIYGVWRRATSGADIELLGAGEAIFAEEEEGSREAQARAFAADVMEGSEGLSPNPARRRLLIPNPVQLAIASVL